MKMIYFTEKHISLRFLISVIFQFFRKFYYGVAIITKTNSDNH